MEHWYKCKDGLPNETKMYAVMLDNGCVTEDLRTPNNRNDRAYDWLMYGQLVESWREMPTPYYPYMGDEGDWNIVGFITPETSEDDVYVFVTDKYGRVHVGRYCGKVDNWWWPGHLINEVPRAWKYLDE